MSGLARKARVVVSIVIILLTWTVTAYAVPLVRGVYFPTPVDTVKRLVALVSGEPLYGRPLYRHLLDSLSRWSFGFLLAAAIGVPLGIVLGYSPLLSDLFMPVVYVLQMIPGLAWIPIALLLFGLGNTPTVFMIFITVLPPIIINTAGGAKSISRKYVRAARMLGADKKTVFFKIILPASTLPVVNGLRIGLGNGWRVLIAAEMVVGVASGIGYSIIESRWSLDFTAAFVCMLLTASIGLIIEKLVFAFLEERVMKRVGLAEAG